MFYRRGPVPFSVPSFPPFTVGKRGGPVQMAPSLPWVTGECSWPSEKQTEMEKWPLRPQREQAIVDSSLRIAGKSTFVLLSHQVSTVTAAA